MNPPLVSSKRTLKRIGPLQLGKMLGLLYGIMGLLFLPVFLLTAFLAPPAPNGGALPVFFGIGFAIAAPFFYAAMGFITGAFGALLYNFLAKWIGGIEVEVE